MMVDFTACGHKNILALHSSTLEITRSMGLTRRGTCVIGVGATMALSDLSEEFRALVRDRRSKITMTISVDGLEEKIMGYGDPRLTLQHPADIVMRKSRFTCDRTLCVKADKAACDLSREMIRLLGNPDQRMFVTLSAEKC
ncbi:DUF371 domain-containing protein [Candidatus Bathyarchaeota archaeon]|nr:DUF371 domain-containing protein [Candidatus Bathyarchaeota archaeon]